MVIISGMQTGVDALALVSAKLVGLPTGGTAPKGWLTLDGPKPHYKELFGMVECEIPGYAARTEENVKNSDGTIRIYSNPHSPGERLTLKLIKRYCKPHIDVNVKSPISPEEVVEWIGQHSINVLNIAGNSWQTSPMCAKFTLSFMLDVYDLMGFPLLQEMQQTKINVEKKLKYGD